MRDPVRILLLADSHLGFDLPASPRIVRRRRGHDFLRNYAAALAPALDGAVDLVVHAGDVFDRPNVPSGLAYQAYAPLLGIADRGTPVFVVPGNHERSVLPHRHLAQHPRVHVFDHPRTIGVEVRGTPLTLSGFPYERRDVRSRFPSLLEQCAWQSRPAALRLLCVHHCFEGATVGPGDFTFTGAADVVRLRDVPAPFAAVLSGHIHRHQVLTRDLRGRALGAPVLYPGSIERTSLAEAGETKGHLVVEASPGATGASVRTEFRELPARPMIVREVAVGACAAALERTLLAAVGSVPADAVLRIRLVGDVARADPRLLSAARLRRMAPSTMNIEITGDGFGVRGPRRERGRRDAPEEVNLRLAL